MCISDINGEDTIIDQGALDEINHHQNPSEKYKFKIIVCIRKSYQRTDIEKIHSKLHQVRPVVSHLGVLLPEKPLIPNNIGQALKGNLRQLQKEHSFVQYHKNKNIGLLLDPIPIKSLPEGKKFFH